MNWLFGQLRYGERGSRQPVGGIYWVDARWRGERGLFS